MHSISSRIEKVSPSLTLAITAQTKAMIAQGEEVYALAGGEPEVDTPNFIKEAAVKALMDGRTKYTPAGGIPELRNALSKKTLAFWLSVILPVVPSSPEEEDGTL